MSMTETEKQKYIDEWQKENLKRYVIKVNKKSYPEIIEHLDKQKSIQGYVIGLILDDIRRERRRSK